MRTFFACAYRIVPRQPRLDLPCVAQHIVQRGNDRCPCFFESADYERYLSELAELSLKGGCALHAYVLMTNHGHLLVTPASTGAVSRLMQGIGRRYVRFVNTKYRRSGTLWEGRFKSAVVDSHDYVLACYRYIELNPVRAKMVQDPADYPWSSHRANGCGIADLRLAPAEAYLALGSDASTRSAAYREFVSRGSDTAQLDAIRSRTQSNLALGSERFEAQIEAMLGRRARPGTPGRPRRSAGES